MHEQPDPQRDPGFDVPGALVEVFAEGGDGDPALRKHREGEGSAGPGGAPGHPETPPVPPRPPRTCPSTGPRGGPGAAPPAGMRIRTGLGAAPWPDRAPTAARTERAARDMAAAP